MRVYFDEYTDIVPSACGNCRYYDGSSCTKTNETKDKEDTCVWFEWRD